MGKKPSGGSGSQADHHANQKNPNNPAFKANRNNRANQLNPNNPAYHSSRGNGGNKTDK